MDTLAVGVFFKIFKKIKLVYDAHEIYPDMKFQNILLNRLFVKLEKFLLGFVDLFFTVAENRKEWYFEKKYSKEPVILGNWKNKLNLKLNIKKEKKKLKINNKILVLYIGSLNRERMVLDLIDSLRNDNRFAFFIGGDGTEKNKIIEAVL